MKKAFLNIAAALFVAGALVVSCDKKKEGEEVKTDSVDSVAEAPADTAAKDSAAKDSATAAPAADAKAAPAADAKAAPAADAKAAPAKK